MGHYYDFFKIANLQLGEDSHTDLFWSHTIVFRHTLVLQVFFYGCVEPEWSIVPVNCVYKLFSHTESETILLP